MPLLFGLMRLAFKACFGLDLKWAGIADALLSRVLYAHCLVQGATAQQEAKARAESGGAPQHFLTRHTHSQSSAGIAAYKFGTDQHRTITDIYQMRQLTASEVDV